MKLNNMQANALANQIYNELLSKRTAWIDGFKLIPAQIDRITQVHSYLSKACKQFSNEWQFIIKYGCRKDSVIDLKTALNDYRIHLAEKNCPITCPHRSEVQQAIIVASIGAETVEMLTASVLKQFNTKKGK